MPESRTTRLARFRYNWFPAYRGTGGRITYIAGDWREVRIRLPLNWRTRNYVGTIFGGSMYGAVDPFYMVMLIRCLGPEYIVWDKTASIRFRRPGTATLFATFVLTDNDLPGRGPVRRALRGDGHVAGSHRDGRKPRHRRRDREARVGTRLRGVRELP
jgi:hypothetical protein